MYRNHNKAKFTWHYVYRHLQGGMCKPAAMGLDAGLDLERKLPRWMKREGYSRE